MRISRVRSRPPPMRTRDTSPRIGPEIALGVFRVMGWERILLGGIVAVFYGKLPWALDVSNGPLRAATLSLGAQNIPIICVAQF